MNIFAPLLTRGQRLRLFVATLSCAAVVVACGGGGSSVDQTPPTVTAQGVTRAVVRKNDTTPLPASFSVTVANPGDGTVTWKDEGGTARGTGNTLSLSAAATALAAGEHTLKATVTNSANGRTGEASFSLLVLNASDNTDDDNDGLTYDQEKAAGTQPGNPDTDGDGLADGAEAGLGTNPALADTNNNGIGDGVELAGAGGASLPARSLLVADAATSPGITVQSDGLSVVFGSELNADCVNKTGVFSAAIYSGSAVDSSERCRKRAVRANVGVKPGEFRYFESHRLTTGTLPNMGQGIITPSAQINPYCCYVDPNDPDYTTYVSGTPAAPTLANPTPPSMTVNSTGGVFVRLVQAVTPFAPGNDINLGQTDYYGFAVDYRGTDPVVYVVAKDVNGAMIVSNGLNPGAFGGANAMPMLHGHPLNGAGPHASINLGALKFHYDLAAVRAAIDARAGAGNGSAMVGGVGIHRW